MLRTALALVVLTAFGVIASAQPRQPQQPPLPLSPGVSPASPFGPGMPFTAPQAPRLSQWQQRFYPTYAPGFFSYFGSPYYPYLNPWGVAPTYVVPVPLDFGPAVAVRPEAPTSIALANEFPATLTLQLPASGEVWLNGKRTSESSSEEHVLTSPVLKTGERYVFDLKARWTAGGKTYETTRLVTVGTGDKSRIIIVSGTEVRE